MDLSDWAFVTMFGGIGLAIVMLGAAASYSLYKWPDHREIRIMAQADRDRAVLLCVENADPKTVGWCLREYHGTDAVAEIALGAAR